MALFVIQYKPSNSNYVVSGITIKVFHIYKRCQSKFSIHLKKAGLASRNIMLENYKIRIRMRKCYPIWAKMYRMEHMS